MTASMNPAKHGMARLAVMAALLGGAATASASGAHPDVHTEVQTDVPAGRSGADGAAPAAIDATDVYAEGEVRRIDREAGRLTLRHGPLKNLDMPGMTMVFDVAEAAVLDGLRPGERVRFQAGKVDGRFVVTRIEPAPSSSR